MMVIVFQPIVSYSHLSSITITISNATSTITRPSTSTYGYTNTHTVFSIVYSLY